MQQNDGVTAEEGRSEYVHGLDQDRRQRGGWRFNKEISIPTVVTVILSVITLVVFIFDLRERVAVNEARVTIQTTAQKAVDDRQDGETLRYQVRMDAQYAAINQALGQLLGSALNGSGGNGGRGGSK